MIIAWKVSIRAKGEFAHNDKLPQKPAFLPGFEEETFGQCAGIGRFAANDRCRESVKKDKVMTRQAGPKMQGQEALMPWDINGKL
ncbi:hypothetical protein [Paenibacillus sp. OAS669]|uniref:hypothetical protein n=1 Tax=Paenibacillus sp. OAS669 TaxID=2663821 RepID=UPI00178B8EC6|nr:hypothetical protein [Paenibacillus sp. OAS669]MBE1446895.1 hypothetical protein [Paenibacillus sp. OAS669]